MILSPPLGGSGTMYKVYLGLIGKCLVDIPEKLKFLPEILGQLAPVGAKLPILNPYSLIVPGQ